MASFGQPSQVLSRNPFAPDPLPPEPSPPLFREHLDSLLDEKAKQLQIVGSLGQRILAQQTELEERIAMIREAENAPGSSSGVFGDAESDMAHQAQGLLQLTRQWDVDTQQTLTALTLGATHVRVLLDPWLYLAPRTQSNKRLWLLCNS